MVHAEPVRKPRRFYKTVDLAETPEGVAVRLDGRPAKSPAGAVLVAPGLALGRLIGEEWGAQGDEIDLAAMPITRMAFTVLDRAPDAHQAMAEEMVRYAGSDALCYLAEGPTALAEREAATWAPWLRWADEELAVKLRTSIGICPVFQSAEALERVRTLASALDDFRLAGLAFAAGLYGSAILAFAVQRGAISGEAAFELSRLEEAFQEEQWGVDEEARARAARLRAEATMIQRWFAALRG